MFKPEGSLYLTQFIHDWSFPACNVPPTVHLLHKYILYFVAAYENTVSRHLRGMQWREMNRMRIGEFTCPKRVFGRKLDSPALL